MLAFILSGYLLRLDRVGRHSRDGHFSSISPGLHCRSSAPGVLPHSFSLILSPDSRAFMASCGLDPLQGHVPQPGCHGCCTVPELIASRRLSAQQLR